MVPFWSSSHHELHQNVRQRYKCGPEVVLMRMKQRFIPTVEFQHTEKCKDENIQHSIFLNGDRQTSVCFQFTTFSSMELLPTNYFVPER